METLFHKMSHTENTKDNWYKLLLGRFWGTQEKNFSQWEQKTVGIISWEKGWIPQHYKIWLEKASCLDSSFTKKDWSRWFLRSLPMWYSMILWLCFAFLEIKAVYVHSFPKSLLYPQASGRKIFCCYVKLQSNLQSKFIPSINTNSVLNPYLSNLVFLCVSTSLPMKIKLICPYPISNTYRMNLHLKHFELLWQESLQKYEMFLLFFQRNNSIQSFSQFARCFSPWISLFSRLQEGMSNTW